MDLQTAIVGLVILLSVGIILRRISGNLGSTAKSGSCGSCNGCTGSQPAKQSPVMVQLGSGKHFVSKTACAGD